MCAYVCVFVLVKLHMCRHACVGLNNHLSILFEISLLLTTAYARVGAPEVSFISPVPTSHLPVGVLGL